MLQMVGPLQVHRTRIAKIISKVVLPLLVLFACWDKTCLPLSKRQCNDNFFRQAHLLLRFFYNGKGLYISVFL